MNSFTSHILEEVSLFGTLNKTMRVWCHCFIVSIHSWIRIYLKWRLIMEMKLWNLCITIKDVILCVFSKRLIYLTSIFCLFVCFFHQPHISSNVCWNLMKIPELTFTRGCHLGFKLDTRISHFLVSLKHIFALIFFTKIYCNRNPQMLVISQLHCWDKPVEKRKWHTFCLYCRW